MIVLLKEPLIELIPLKIFVYLSAKYPVASFVLGVQILTMYFGGV